MPAVLEVKDDAQPSNSGDKCRKRVVWIPSKIHPVAMQRAIELFDVVTPDDPRAKTWWDHAEAAVIRTASVTEEDLSKCTKLRIITRNGSGYDRIDIAKCKELGIPVTNLPGHNAKAVSELVLGLTLSVLRRITEFDRRLKRGETILSIDALAQSLDGKIVGLVGMGWTARSVAERMQAAFDCPILVYSPTSHPKKWTSSDPSGLRPITHVRATSLEQLLQEADVISLHCPLLTAGEKGDVAGSNVAMIGQKEFAMMKKGRAVLINTARGALIDENALLIALQTNQIYGAGLDCHPVEPPTLQRYRDLFQQENVVVQSHAGAGTEEVQISGCLKAVETAYLYLNDQGFGDSTRVV